MKFGEQFRELRVSRPRPMLQQDVAALAGVSIATVSQIERGTLIPSNQTAKKLMDTLERSGEPIDRATRAAMYRNLKQERAERGERAGKQHGSLAFGAALRELLAELNLSGADLTSRPRSTINAWVTGILLPSDKTLVEELIPELKARDASDANIQTLTLAHLRDVLSKSLALAYLNEDAQKKVTSAALRSAETELG
jgi:DNA-binding XRE family transcriptional regulator